MRIAWPVLVELLLGSLFSMVDLMMLGRLPDPAISAASVAAVGISNQILFIGFSLVQALNVGGTALIARYWGAGEKHRLTPVLKHVLLINMVLLTVPFVGLMQVYSVQMLRFMGASDNVMTVGHNYFRTVILGFLFQSANLSFSASLRGIGETRVPMKVNLIANFGNVIGNALLIYGIGPFPALGATGAAISTALSQVFASAMLIRVLSSRQSPLCLFDGSGSRFRFDRHLAANLIRIGVPASAEQLVMRVGLITFARIVTDLGDVVFAAHQTALSLLGLTFNPGAAFGISASALTGQALGAGEPHVAELRSRTAARMGLVISISMSVVFLLFAPQLCSLYSTNEEVVAQATVALRIIALIQPFQGVQLVYAGALRGAGDTFSPFIATLVSLLGLRTILAVILVIWLGWGLPGAWIAIFFDQLVRWAIIFFRFRAGRWKKVRIG